MTASLSPTLAVTTTPPTSTTPASRTTTAATSRAVGVPCAARPGTSFRHRDGRCQCFFGGAAPELAALPDPRPDAAGRSSAT